MDTARSFHVAETQDTFAEKSIDDDDNGKLGVEARSSLLRPPAAAPVDLRPAVKLARRQFKIRAGMSQSGNFSENFIDAICIVDARACAIKKI
jgi:hypothetical protein